MRQSGTAGTALVAAAIITIACLLRPPSSALGPVILKVQHDLGFGPVWAGFLQGLGPFSLAILGLMAATAASRAELKTLMVLASIGLIVGSVTRSLASEGWLFSLGTAVALASGALATVLIPSLILRWFPRYVARMSSMLAAGVIAGTALGSAVTPVVAEATGSWRYGLALWGAVSIVPLILWSITPRTSAPVVTTSSMSPPPHRMAVGWIATFFAIHSASGSVVLAWLPALLTDKGVSSSSAGLAVGLFSVVGVPAALLLPSWVDRRSWAPSWALAVGSAIVTMMGWMGLAARPSWYFGWVILFGLGMAAYPWTLMKIVEGSADQRAAMWATGRVNLVGYGFAGAAPLLVGVMIGAHLGSRLIFLVVAATGPVYMLAGWLASRTLSKVADHPASTSFAA